MTNNDELAMKLKNQHIPAKYYLAECQECGELMPSNRLNVLTSPDDESECYCPHCQSGEINDLGIGDEPGALAWNFQQLRIEALLAERDADKALIVELDARLIEYARISTENANRAAEMEQIRAAAEKLVRCKGRYHSEQNYRALAALFGVKTPDLPTLETEVRSVRLNAADIINVAEGKNNAPGRMIPIDTLGDYCADAGIKLEVGE